MDAAHVVDCWTLVLLNKEALLRRLLLSCTCLAARLKDTAPTRGSSERLTLRGFERELGLMLTEEGIAGRAAALNTATPIALRVIARVALALRLHPLGDLQFVGEPEHD